MAESVTAQPKTSLFANRNYRLLWSGQSLSIIGDYFFSATLTLWIIDKLVRNGPWLPLATGAVALALVIPSLLIGPFAGVWVDRWNRRWTMLWTDVARTVLVALFLVLTFLVSDRTVLLISGVTTLALVGTGQQFFLPARTVVIADIVPSEVQHPAAYGSLQQAKYLGQIVGPTLAAPLYVALGSRWAISLDVLSFVVSCLLLLLIRMPVQHRDETQEPVGFWHEFREGLHFFVSNRVLMTLLLSGMFFMLGDEAYEALEYLYGSQNLHIANVLLGLYVACYGIGVVLGLLLLTPLVKRLSEVEVLWICMIGYGLALLVLSRVTTILPGMACGLLLGLTNASVFVTVRPLTVLVTPRKLIGRVMAFEGPMITIASLVGGLWAGVLASTVFLHVHARLVGMSFGDLDSVLILAGLLTVASGVFARLTLYPVVKAMRARSEGPPHEVEPQQG